MGCAWNHPVFVGKDGESCCSGVMWVQIAVLCLRKGTLWVNVGKDDPFHYFGSGAEKRNWPLRSWSGWCFVGLEDRNDCTMFPMCGYCTVCITVVYYACTRITCVPWLLRWMFVMSGHLACEFFSLLMIFYMADGEVRVVVWSSGNYVCICGSGGILALVICG